MQMQHRLELACPDVDEAIEEERSQAFRQFAEDGRALLEIQADQGLHIYQQGEGVDQIERNMDVSRGNTEAAVADLGQAAVHRAKGFGPVAGLGGVGLVVGGGAA
eukprot:Hpha_TRINITY_DN16413_c2_g5::TRINITY_DN16413_c2_g5_i1::g.160498::m.160498